jgi:ABC-type nitrate/sulfonate/bicarbonate transport system substrate-binding protein
MIKVTTTWLRALVAATAMALVLAGPSAGRAQGLQTIGVGTTSKTANDWALYVGEKYGFFAANGIAIDEVSVGANSGVAQQLTGAAFDVGDITTTQLILAIAGGAPLVSIMNAGTGVPYYLIGSKGLRTVAQLKGKQISIGGPSDITRPFADTILQRGGLKPDDWTYTYAGASTARYAALVAGAIDATLLAPPVVFRAIADGYPVIDNVPKYFPSFPYITWSVRSAWAKDHADLVVRFIRAQLQAIRWLNDPANKDKAIALLSEQTGSSSLDASRSYDVFITSQRYFSPTGTYAPGAFARVQSTMLHAGMMATPLPDVTKVYDNSYAVRAAAGLRGK